MGIKLIFIICLVAAELNAQNPSELTLYEGAIEIIKSDSSLLRSTCYEGTSYSLKVHDKFEYFRLAEFRSELSLTYDKSLEDTIETSDKAAYKKSLFIDYRIIVGNLNSKYDSLTKSCAIVCFDRFRNGFLLAEITDYYGESGDWGNDIRMIKGSWFLLFDFNFEPVKYYKFQVQR